MEVEVNVRHEHWKKLYPDQSSYQYQLWIKQVIRRSAENGFRGTIMDGCGYPVINDHEAFTDYLLEQTQ